jgi:Esterase-like activity of phytase
MNMIGHEHIGMNIALMFLRRRVELFRIKVVIVLCSKNALAIIATLDEMLRLAGYYKLGKRAMDPTHSLLTMIKHSHLKLNEGAIEFTRMTEMLDIDGDAFEAASVDPEAMRLIPFPGLLYWTSEGDADNGISPFVRVMTRSGNPLAEFAIPEKYLPTENSGIRNNLAFEMPEFFVFEALYLHDH